MFIDCRNRMEIRMADKKKCLAVVVSQEKITEGIYSMWLQFPEDYNVAGMAVPGQFISMYCGEGSRLLPRPISICEIEPAQRKLRVVYRVAGKGTEEFSEELLRQYADPDSPKHAAMVEVMRRRIGADTLRFQRLEDLVRAIGLPKEELCTHCWDNSSYL